MVILTGIFHRLQPQTVLVVGDFMLDVYTEGKIERISPEAPVSVLHVEKEEDRPGGAGNVALNLKSLGSTPIPVGRVGSDKEGQRLIKALEKQGVDTSGIFIEPHTPTIVKNRLIASQQQMIRVDYEKIVPLSEQLEEEILKFIQKKLPDISVIALSDYGKGFLSNTIISRIIELGNESGIPTLVDPKGKDFSKYAQCTLIKPNLSEAITASSLTGEDSLKAIANELLKVTRCQHLLITRASEGISLFSNKGVEEHFGVPKRSIRDVTGAGDTVLATLCLGIGSKLSLTESIEISNLAAGIAIEHFGCAHIKLKDLAHSLLQIDCVNKVFDDQHLSPLETLLKDKPFTILSITITEHFSTALFRVIRDLDKQYEGKLIIYMDGLSPDDDLVHLLASLVEVNFIILKKENLELLLEKLVPNQTFIYKKEENLKSLKHPKALLSIA
jgi:D-glycero-beta-D-manno-heptose-7-phosphate kinase